MSKKIVLASSNIGKQKEISPYLSRLGWDVSLQSAFSVPVVDETGTTFVENAILKARNAAALTALPALADDSGLVVPQLAGRPGIHSARYAGQSATYPEKFKQLFAEIDALANKPQRVDAYFYCVLVFMRSADDPAPLICEGRWQGQLCSPSGNGGFGYDPIFYLTEHNCTAAELDLATKSKISHRGQALASLLQKLKH